jgi:hypothetical protein
MSGNYELQWYDILFSLLNFFRKSSRNVKFLCFSTPRFTSASNFYTPHSHNLNPCTHHQGVHEYFLKNVILNMGSRAWDGTAITQFALCSSQAVELRIKLQAYLRCTSGALLSLMETSPSHQVNLGYVPNGFPVTPGKFSYTRLIIKAHQLVEYSNKRPR